MILGLRTAIYPVADLEAGKNWYRALLGVDPYFDEPFYVGFAVGGFELGLVPDARGGLDGVQACWGVPDAAAGLERLLSLGAGALDPVQDVGGGIRVAAVIDPFGNRFSIIENPNFKTSDVR